MYLVSGGCLRQLEDKLWVKQKIPKRLLKRGYWKGLQAEYKKIIWPDKETVAKQTGAVVAVAIALGLIIAALDTIIVTGLHFVI